MIFSFIVGTFSLGACSATPKTDNKKDASLATNSTSNENKENDNNASLYNAATMIGSQPQTYFQHGFSQEQLDELGEQEEQAEQ